MRKFTLWVLTLLGGLLTTQNAFADHLSSKYLFSARLNGAQSVPVVTTNAVGVATFFLNDSRDTLCIKATFNGLSGDVTGAHLHQAPMGANGPVVVDLMPYTVGNHIEAVITGSSLTSALIADMLGQQLYLNVHTAANPNGEIRGQVKLETDHGMAVMLDGSQQVPPVTTTGSGLGFFWLSQHQDRLSFDITFDGLSSMVTGAHLHVAPMGVSGPVVKDLMPYMSGNRISGSFDTVGFLNQLMMDSIYINIHTANNANGEIRGQLTKMPYIYYDGHLTGGQQVPPVATSAIGEAVLRLNYTFDTLWYDVQVNALSGAIADAHLHFAPPGSNGGVVVAVPSTSINGNVISGYYTGVDLQDSLIEHLNKGEIYLNIHTLANPNGEIRAQIYRTFREGYTFTITGAQEVPMVNTVAQGSGMVSVNREQTDAHIMAVVTNIMPNGVHLHNNVAGQNGGVIYDLTGIYNNGGIYTFWRDTDMTTPFNSMMSNKFRKDSVYINYHTMANPNGEIRGNSSRMLCLPVALDVKEIGKLQAEVKLYPNPAQSSADLDIVISGNTGAEFELVDITGRKVWNSNKQLFAGANRITIPLSGISAGVYFVKISTGQGTLSYKLVKE